MTDETRPSAAEALKRALAAKRGAKPAHADLTGGHGGEKAVTGKNPQGPGLAKPAFRKASKRG